MKSYKGNSINRTIALAMLVFVLATLKAHAGEVPVLKVQRVSDADLALIQGKYFGANLLVGVRVDLVSNWRAPE